MQKSPTYHEDAILYNEWIADATDALAPKLTDPDVIQWNASVGKQHRFHAKRHQSALNKQLAKKEPPEIVESIVDGLDVPLPKTPMPPENAKREGNEVTWDLPNSVEPEVVTAPAAALPDGCDPYHDPTNPNCEFNPANMNKGDSDA